MAVEKENMLDNILSKEQALKSLNSWIPSAKNYYAKNRNYDVNGERTTSRLSKFISCGLLSENEIIKSANNFGVTLANNKFIEEIFWRIYFRGYLENRPSLWSDYLNELNQKVDIKNSKEYKTAILGKTGIQCFDVWTENLKSKGYLHNHARMWYASIWIFTLGLPWQLGADFFLKNLIDADEASNTISWRWVAGLHTSNKPYIARPDNIFKFTKKYYPKDELNLNPTPVSEDKVFKTSPLKNCNNICSLNGSILIHDNFFPLNILNKIKCKKIYVLESEINPLYRISRIWNFVQPQIVKSISKKYNVDPIFIRMDELYKINDLPIITNRPREGLWKDISVKFFDLLLLNEKIKFITPEIDALSWNYCKNGYFNLKKNIPNILNRITGQVKIKF